MKFPRRILYSLIILIGLSVSGFAQGASPIRVREVDGTPSRLGVTELIVSNGSLTISGTKATIVTGAGGASIGGAVTGGTTGSVLFVNPTAIMAQDNDNFFWDDTNNRLGIQTNSPSRPLQVNGSIGSAGSTLRVKNTSTSGYSAIEYERGNFSDVNAIIGYSNESTSFGLTSFWQTPNGDDIRFYVTTTEKFKISASATTVSNAIVYAATTPAQITSNQNNYNPGGNTRLQRWSTDASRNVTGLTFSTAQVMGQEYLIVNVGTNDIVLTHQDTNSTDVNRFLNSSGANITLTANQAALAIYDGTTQRYRVFKQN